MDRQLQVVSHMADSLEMFDLDKSAGDVRKTISEVVTWAPREYAAALAGRADAAEEISAAHLVPALGRAEGGIREAEQNLRRRTATRVAGVATAISHAKNVSTLAAAVALALVGVIGVWLTRSIARPVHELERGMEAVADGGFSYKLPLSRDRRDEFGRLASSFEDMTKQLAELDKLKAEFVSIASHELKTPINVVLGYIELLDEGVYGQLTAEQREVLRTLETQVKALARLVRQLLDISRFEAGGNKLDLRHVRLPDFLDELERAFQVLARQRDIRFTVHRADGLPDKVCWDADRMNEVMGNLLSNAFKFTDRGGEVHLAVDAADSGIQLEVRDSGAGIPPDQLPHIFEKFYQADNQRAAATKGSGLGLAIAKGIIEAHGGAIHCESTPGVGTTFTVVLPAQQPSGRRSSVERAIPAGAA
jgi:signal transduction histidine kinase